MHHVIDLGELNDDASGTPPDAPLRRLRPTRRVLLAVVAVLAAATLTGSVHHEPPIRAAGIPAGANDVAYPGRDNYVVVSDTADPPGSPVENKIVNVYALPSATHESRTSVSVTGPILQVAAVDGLVLVSYQSDDADTMATAAYTAGTERTVWRRYGRLFGLGPSGRVALLADFPVGARQPRWFGVEVRTGETDWQSDRQPDGTPSPIDPNPVSSAAVIVGTTLVIDADQRPEKLVDVSTAGRIQVRDIDTGRFTATATVPAPAAWRTVGLRVGVTDGLLLVGTVGRGTPAYDLSDLTERWRSPQDLADWQVRPRCGDVICLVNYDGGLRILEPDTGRQRWGADGWTDVERAGSALLVTPAAMEDPTATPPLTVLDAATGRPRGTLAGWRLIRSARADGAALVVREQGRVGQSYFGILDPGTLTVRVLGTGQVAGDCGSTADILVCRRTDSSFGVWRLAAR